MEGAGSLPTLHEARQLAERGEHVAVIELLEGRPPQEIAVSPTLALLYGTAHARLGRHADGERWVDVALSRARERGDRVVELRALNIRGAVALEAGRHEEAAEWFQRAIEPARREGDLATVGRCSNNLGIIDDLRGRYGPAVTSYTIALAAFQQAGWRRGVAETRHNLAIAYRHQGDMVRALEEAEHAVEAAGDVGDRALGAQTLAGRAEIRVAAGHADLGRREVEHALALHRYLGDEPGQAEDLRILAGALRSLGRVGEAEALLREVIERAAGQRRPLLQATAGRDLAFLLADEGRPGDAKQVARTARDHFRRLGAEVDVRTLNELLATPSED